jgi:hypothetical protein
MENRWYSVLSKNDIVTASWFAAHIQAVSSNSFNIQDAKGDFSSLHVLLDNLFKELHQQGIGTEKVQAQVITFEEESQLWASGVLGDTNPVSLLNAVFYLNGINFTLRGGAEHRQLRVSQLKFNVDEQDKLEYVIYTEYGSKNRPGGRKQLNLSNKAVRFYSQQSLGSRCHVYLLKLYISKLPQTAIDKDLFYCKPLSKLLTDKPWYCAVPVGHNTLDKKLKEIFLAAGIDSHGKTNHSLRATSINRMFHAKVPEKMIMQRSGHMSKEGLRSYEHTSLDQSKGCLQSTFKSRKFK